MESGTQIDPIRGPAPEVGATELGRGEPLGPGAPAAEEPRPQPGPAGPPALEAAQRADPKAADPIPPRRPAPAPEPMEQPVPEMSEMQQLLESSEAMHSARRGEVVDGVIMRIDRDGLLINIGAKSEGVISFREMRSLTQQEIDSLQVGDSVVAYILRMDDSGQVLLSYDRARGERVWRTLQEHLDSGDPVEAKVVGFNRGGLLVGVDGVQGFVPLSQMATSRRAPEGEDQETLLAPMMGQVLRLKVIEINRRRQRVILSERAALQTLKDEQKEKLLEALKEGEVRRGRVTGLQEFGAFVDLGGADGLIHISELSWGPVTSPADVVHEGQEVDVYVMRVDLTTKRISLSLRRAQEDPWTKVASNFREGQQVQGTITRLTPFGAFARLEGNIEGLIHISELSDQRIRHPREVVREGDVLSLKVLRVEPERRRLGLSLRQAAEAE